MVIDSFLHSATHATLEGDTARPAFAPERSAECSNLVTSCPPRSTQMHDDRSDSEVQEMLLGSPNFLRKFHSHTQPSFTLLTPIAVANITSFTVTVTSS